MDKRNKANILILGNGSREQVILDKLYKKLSVPSYNYKIIIQLNSSCKKNIISNEKTNYKYIQLININ